MTTRTVPSEGRNEIARSGVPVWRLVFTTEMRELWVGGRALVLTVLYSIMMSLTSVLLFAESEMSLIPPKEMIFLVFEASIAFSVFIGLVNGADSISGERERDILEALLVTPASRRQFVIGKFLASMSPWPVTFLLGIPYVYILSQGDPLLGHGLIVSAIMGTLLVTGLTGLGTLLSIVSNSNKTSIFVSLIIYLLLIIPTQFPWQAQVGAFGDFIQGANPMEATHHFMEKIIVNNRDIEEVWTLLPSTITLAVAVVALMLLYFGPGLNLQGGVTNVFRVLARRKVIPMLILGSVLLFSLHPVMIIRAESGSNVPMAQDEPTPAPGEEEEEEEAAAGGAAADEAAAPEEGSAPEGASALLEVPLELTINTEYVIVNSGDNVEFTTTVTNTGDEETPDIVMAMNMVNLGEGEPVDPEDWSPERNQDVTALAPGDSASQTWLVNAILDGDYMVYIVAIPEPDGEESTSRPIATSGIHVTVQAFVRGNPSGVLPFAIGMPIGLILVSAFIRRRWRSGIESRSA